jgi:hypothetical protein
VSINLSEILKGVGLSESSLDKVRLGSGVVGRSSAVALMTMIAFCVIAYSLRDPLYLIMLGVLAAAVFAGYFIGVLRFAAKNPDLALLEGAELVRWRQIEMAAKDHPSLPGSSQTQIGQSGVN